MPGALSALLSLPSALAGAWSTGEVGDHTGPNYSEEYTTGIVVAGYATELTLVYGTWNTPPVELEVYFDGTFVGSVVSDASVPYHTAPGAQTWDITALVTVDATHEIEIVALDASGPFYYPYYGEAVVVEVSIAWNSDDDADGFGGLTDCDDGDPDVYPGADEHCDGVDEDCDGVVDNDPLDPVTLYSDADSDGYGLVEISGCPGQPHTAAVPGDCDDANASVHPGANEYCDTVDRNCDGSPDLDAVDAPLWFSDGDGDGWGGSEDPVVSCAQPPDRAPAGDCNDSDAAVYPGADEHCDGVDEDCDGALDNDPVDPMVWFVDADADGFGGPSSELACEPREGSVATPGDCNDGDPAIYPGAVEICDGRDNDCNGIEDRDAVDRVVSYADLDEDGFGDPAVELLACPGAPLVSDNADDCDDVDPRVNPDGVEVCNGRDDDCDGTIDEEAVDAVEMYADADGDGFGDPDRPIVACGADAAATRAGDCDDDDPAVYPNAPGLGGEDGCEPVDKGCGCATGAPAALPWGALIGLGLGWRRRRAPRGDLGG